jgi:hypothetical protein
MSLEAKMGHMPQIKRQTDRKDMQNPPAGLESHKIFEHSHLQRKCPRAYTAAIPAKCIIHHHTVKKDICLEIVLMFINPLVIVQDGCHDITC